MSHCFAQDADKSLVKQYDKKIKAKSVAIDSIKNELIRGRKRVQELDKKEGLYLERLEILEKNVENSYVFLKTITEQIDTLAVHIELLKDSLVIVSGELKERQLKMKQRLRDIYKTGQPRMIEIILTSQTVSDMLHRIKYFQELNRYDRQLLQEIDSTKMVVTNHKQQLENEQQELVALKTGKEQETAALKKEQKKRKSVLAEVQDEKKAYVAMIKELELAQEELNLLVKRLEKKRKEVKIEVERGLQIAFEKRKGKLPWPADGTVIREYGKIIHPVYKTVTMCNGVDIKAPKGDKVFSVAPGKVDYIGWMRGYGKFVIVNHFGGYLTIYAHLDKVSVAQDQDVKYGEELGAVGETGSLTGPKLHFQIRQSSETLNPRKWLEKKE
jgi:septal ring factor EnvC (AmiA/AmiB activator)